MLKPITRHILCLAVMLGGYSAAAATTLSTVDYITAQLEKIADAKANQ